MNQLLCRLPILGFPKVGTLQGIAPESYVLLDTYLDVHCWDASICSRHAAHSGYLLLVPRDAVDITSPLWSKKLTTLGTE